MADYPVPRDLDQRLLAVARARLRELLQEARQTDNGVTCIPLPATAIDGLLGMLENPSSAAFSYRRRQFISFFARFTSTSDGAEPHNTGEVRQGHPLRAPELDHECPGGLLLSDD